VARNTNQDVLFSAESLYPKQETPTSLVTAVERKVMQCRYPGRYFQPRRTPLSNSAKQSHTTDISIVRNLPLSSIGSNVTSNTDLAPQRRWGLCTLALKFRQVLAKVDGSLT
jgi:hypothetical protein